MTTTLDHRMVGVPAIDEQPLSEYLRASNLRTVVIGASKDPNAKVMLLLVDPSTRQPVLAVKVPTTDVAEAAVQAEREILERVTAAASPDFALTIPQVVGSVDHDGRRALVTTALRGRSMAAAYALPRHTRSASRVTHDFEVVERWADALQSAPVGDAPAAARDSSELLRRRFLDAPEWMIERAAELDAALASAVPDPTIVHGDLWFGNVLVSDGQVSGVVDWEAGSHAADPTRDAARFAHVYALYLDRHTRPGRAAAGHAGLSAGEWGAAVDFALNGAGWFPTIFRDFLRRALERAGASPDHWHTLALSAVAELAARTDHDDFARLHLELFARLACRPSERI
ncbi:MAG TPA: phosphotransferase [Gaiellaceae bacterium]